MKFEVKSTPLENVKTDLLVVLLDKDIELSATDHPLFKGLLRTLASDYTEKRVKKEFFTRWEQNGIRHLLVFHSQLNSLYNLWEKVKIFASKAMTFGNDFNLSDVTFLLNGKDAPAYFGKVVEGIIIGSYNFEKYRKEKNLYYPSAQVNLLCKESALPVCIEKYKHYSLISNVINECRDTVNEPGSAVTPEVLGSLASQIGRQFEMPVSILNEKELAASGYMGLSSVGKGSIHPPRLITLEYTPFKPSSSRLALIGKGITFDTGGISLKPSDRMLEMKGDMAGGAAVLYTMKVIAQLKPAISVVGIVPSAENSPDANAQRPGDIFTAKNGKSVQVDNTDAEGRLVLIDGFARAAELKATHIVDIATLTGAVVRALGQEYAGIMGNNQLLIDAVIKSGINHGENYWQLPLPEEYKELLKTPYADINNVGGPKGGAITAGLFLQEFIPENTAWAHLDIAGPFIFDKPWKYYAAGATGFGVKTFVDLTLRFGEYFPQ